MNSQGHQTGKAAPETRDADVINLFLIGALLLLIIGICLLVCWGILHLFNRGRLAQEPPRLQMVEEAAKFPQPHLIKKPGSELAGVRVSDERQLRTYGWVDRKAGVARIPIRRAMQLLVERGLPEVGAGQTRLQLMQSRPQTNVQPSQPITSPAPEATP